MILIFKRGSEMISSVTTVVSTVISSSTVTGLVTALGLAGALTLISCLIIKEFTTTQGSRLRVFGRNLNIIILPLLFVFSFTVFMKIVEILS
jgi:hypothetical protein